MKMTIKKGLSAILAVLLCLSAAGCARGKVDREIKPADTKEKNLCIIDGKEIHFADDTAKQAWKDALIPLLKASMDAEREYGMFVDSDMILNQKKPVVPPSHTCGLLDVNLDGTPELLFHPNGFGGSAGNITYFAFDLATGKCIGSFDGGYKDSWCLYYDTETETVQWIGQYWWRYGWSERDRFVSTLAYDSADGQYKSQSYLRTYLMIDPALGDGYGDPTARYFVRDEEVQMDTFYGAHDAFRNTFIRIPETALTLLRWEDVSEEDDSPAEAARKMAEALIGTEQAFMVP